MSSVKTPDIQIFSPASFPSVRKSWLDSVGLSYSASLPKESFNGFAGTDLARAKELAHILNKSVIAMASRGGYGCQRMLEFVEIPNNVKAKVCGFSDLTVLLNYLHQNYGVQCIHGPMLQWPSVTTFDSLMMRSFESLVLNEYAFECEFRGSLINCEILEGNVIGGNLSVLCSSFGTKYAPSLEKNILFLEEINEATYRVDRMLDQLSKQIGFNQLKGIIFGAFEKCEVSPVDSQDMEVDEVIRDFCERYEIPAVINAPIGHINDFVCLPLGAYVELRLIKSGCVKWSIEVIND